MLRPGGRLMASVAFLTPYIPLTQFHWSHVGAMNTAQAAGLEIEAVLADRNWSSLEAGAALGLFPRMPSRATRALVAPIKGLHRLWWWVGARRAGRPVSSRGTRRAQQPGDIDSARGAQSPRSPGRAEASAKKPAPNQAVRASTGSSQSKPAAGSAHGLDVLGRDVLR